VDPGGGPLSIGDMDCGACGAGPHLIAKQFTKRKTLYDFCGEFLTLTAGVS